MTTRHTVQTHDTYVTTRTPADAARPAPAAATAIIAWHGMGQQLPFETLAAVAEALAEYHVQAGGVVPAVTTREVELGGERLRRAELLLTDPKGTREVHVYEAYWAPLTEGKITLAETVQFLLGAGVQGVRYGLWPPRVLERFLFGRWVAFPLSPLLALVYLVLLATLLSLLVVNGAVVGAIALKLLTDPGAADRWPDYALLRNLTLDLTLLAVTFLPLGAALATTFVAAVKGARPSAPLKKRPLVAALIWFLVALAVAVTIAVGALIAYHTIAHGIFAGTMWPWGALLVDGSLVFPGYARLFLVFAVVVWIVVLAGSAVIRWFLLEFVGDTAIYTSSHTLNRFYETAEAVKARSTAVAGAIYRHGHYKAHVLIGHSLGSVIAYDTLNRLIVDDQMTGGVVAVAARTALLVTFGSILDKTAFLFRVQIDHSEVREALASSIQPLISDPLARPPWVNIFSRQDIFSGVLDYYDPANGNVGGGPPAPAPPHPIVNVADPDAWIPILAHGQYWTNRLLVETIYAAIP